MSERVVVGLSGGVDSSVAAALLVEQGFDVVGVTLRVWPWHESEDPTKRFGSCCSPATVDDARQVARRLGISYYLLNSAEEFERTVIDDFAREYAAARRCRARSATVTSSSGRFSPALAPGKHLQWPRATMPASREIRPRGGFSSGG